MSIHDLMFIFTVTHPGGMLHHVTTLLYDIWCFQFNFNHNINVLCFVALVKLQKYSQEIRFLVSYFNFEDSKKTKTECNVNNSTMISQSFVPKTDKNINKNTKYVILIRLMWLLFSDWTASQHRARKMKLFSSHRNASSPLWGGSGI